MMAINGIKYYRGMPALKYSEKAQDRLLKGPLTIVKRFRDGKIHHVSLSGHQTEWGYKWRKLSRIIHLTHLLKH